MNPLHLAWIVPLSAFFGFGLCACFTVASMADEVDLDQ